YLDGNYNNCIDWIEDVFRELDNKATADFLTLLWNSWNDRNNMVFKGKMDAASCSIIDLMVDPRCKSLLSTSGCL
ncbi:hypothetical protein Godav_014946, partial [Gossypium davidsonii]|nr:hypothetical protein [Gossypium davidsonii]